jgi:DNA-binding MarR family transcriptional regulator
MNVRDCIFFQLTKASQAGVGFWANQVKHLGVTASQAMLLNFLGEEDRILSRSLGQKLQISSATMTGILDRLEKMELVERQPHPDDRRAILICLTEQGRSCARELHSIMVKANKQYLAGLGSGKLSIFRETLKNLSEVNG